MSTFTSVMMSEPGAGSAPFEHPWQAQVFSLVVCLHKAGLFSWKTWVDVFSTEIKAHPAMAHESVNDAYYRQWVAATEKMLMSLQMADEAEIARRTDEWRQAYLNTPHGMPVTLVSASCPPEHVHHHPMHRVPVAISPGTSQIDS
ncbi:nitrile hydratase accessory protein [Erwinia sp. S38]|uniref:nitrile hydratase accessory protein n=1 Tax=Erwinia sp. S38 TaxID=2769338 RepID=UPI00190C3AB4|nr:nitrile hydratase accessory protein [Erwinia sp. S38]MBK0004800.1 nitrile hydratase accessory protein [Erwinia sp. S38]